MRKELVFHDAIFLIAFVVSVLTQPAIGVMRELNYIARRSPSINKINLMLRDEIRLHKLMIDKLDMIRKEFIDCATDQYIEDHNSSIQEENLLGRYGHLPILHLDRLEDPIQAFIIVNRLHQTFNLLEDYLQDSSQFKNSGLDSDFEELITEGLIPRDLHQEHLAKAILRISNLQDYSIDELVHRSHLPSSIETRVPNGKDVDEPLRMGYQECFELGKILYKQEKWAKSIGWFKKAEYLIESKLDAENPSTSKYLNLESELVDILDYASFAAYKDGQFKYAIQLAKRILKFHPNHERTIENIEYFREEIDKIKSRNKNSIPKEIGNSNDIGSFRYGESSLKEKLVNQEQLTETSDGILGPDSQAAAEKLCLSYVELPVSSLTCSSKPSLIIDLPSSMLKIETLSIDPKIIRIHDLISEVEAAHIIAKAEPMLEKSTIQTKAGTTTSDYRVALSAWISQKEDLVVERIENRLSKVLNLNLDESEALQVVSYNFGGYYGPHYDASRRTNPIQAVRTESPEVSRNITHSDRLATILIYLNDVEIGGSTVFPWLNLKIEPIANSAIFWYNIKEDGFTDEMTLHSGCPIIKGTKWIATKWPREHPNMFQRRCKQMSI